MKIRAGVVYDCINEFNYCHTLTYVYRISHSHDDFKNYFPILIYLMFVLSIAQNSSIRISESVALIAKDNSTSCWKSVEYLLLLRKEILKMF